MDPSAVNLIALLTRLIKICDRRKASPRSAGDVGSDDVFEDQAFFLNT
jgi:hypothetical protein